MALPSFAKAIVAAAISGAAPAATQAAATGAVSSSTITASVIAAFVGGLSTYFVPNSAAKAGAGAPHDALIVTVKTDVNTFLDYLNAHLPDLVRAAAVSAVTDKAPEAPGVAPSAVTVTAPAVVGDPSIQGLRR